MTNTNDYKTELPTGWVWANLSIACNKIQDGTHFSPKVQYSSPGKNRYLYITAKNIRPQSLDLSQVSWVDEEVHRSIYNRCNPENGDVLLTKDGVNTGMAAVNTLKEEFSLLSSVALLKPHKIMLNPDFLTYYLNSPIGFKMITGKMTGTAIKRIILAKIRESYIPLPPLAEQQRIVDKIEELFSDLDHSVAALETARAQLDIYRQAVLKHAFEGKLTEPWRQQRQPPPAADLLAHIQAEREARYQQERDVWQAEVAAWESQGKPGRKPAKPKKPQDLPPLTEAELAELPSLPEGWAWVRLEPILIDLKNGYFGGRPSDEPIGTPILRINAVRPMSVTFEERRYLPNVDEDKLEEYSLIAGDLLFTRYNGSRDLAGACGLVRTKEYPLLYPDKLIRVRVENQVLPNFLEAYFVSLQGRYFIEQKLKTTAGQYGISGTDLRQIPIPLPSLTEQRAIVEEIEARLSVVDKLAETIDTALQQAEALRQSILKQAFAGKLVPQNADDEPAEVLLERIKRP